MSENLWVEFDKKIAALGSKADELEQMKGKLQNIPERLVNVKAQIKKLRESAQGLASKSVRTEIQKDIQKKVEELDKIFKKLESTKTTSDPILAKLETALGELENYTAVKDSEIKQPESTPQMNPVSTNPTIIKSRRIVTPPTTPPAKPVAAPLTPAAKPTAKPAAMSVVGPVTPATKLTAKPTKFAAKPNSVLSSNSPSFKPGAGPKQPSVAQASQPAFKPGAGPNQPAVKKATSKNTQKPAWNPSTKPDIKLGGYFSHKKYSKKKHMKKQHKSKKHKKSKKFQKVYKVKKNKSRKGRR